MMTVEELKKEGAIYFEKVTDGMQQYENQIIRMNAFQAVDKFMEMWEMLGCKNICAKLNATEMLFCTIYMTGDYPSTWWGNYGGEYVVFTEKEA